MSKGIRAKRTQGMHWIRDEKRLAIYVRDGLGCVYCKRGIEQDAKLTLDHLVPYSMGGSNKATNLVTCCSVCNSSRGTRSYRVFAAAVAVYRNPADRLTTEIIVRDIKNCTARKIDVQSAKTLIALRGGFVSACKGK
tara:strand:+ start:1228 stop:1638 length:411 start_codon:yes stop_codon:yes gene_type:complete